MGALATRLLIKQIDNLRFEHKEVQVPVKLIQRGAWKNDYSHWQY